jgi:hypothetical protein
LISFSLSLTWGEVDRGRNHSRHLPVGIVVVQNSYFQDQYQDTDSVPSSTKNDCSFLLLLLCFRTSRYCSVLFGVQQLVRTLTPLLNTLATHSSSSHRHALSEVATTGHPNIASAHITAAASVCFSADGPSSHPSSLCSGGEATGTGSDTEGGSGSGGDSGSGSGGLGGFGSGRCGDALRSATACLTPQAARPLISSFIRRFHKV